MTWEIQSENESAKLTPSFMVIDARQAETVNRSHFIGMKESDFPNSETSREPDDGVQVEKVAGGSPQLQATMKKRL